MNMGCILGFAGWTAMSLFFVALGIYDFRTDKRAVVGFWANVKTPPMKDVKAYNRAVGKLFIAFGAVLFLLGLPLLGGQNTPLILLSVIGTMIAAIVVMAVYIVGIQGKYEAGR